jgi:hypothetical protein
MRPAAIGRMMLRRTLRGVGSAVFCAGCLVFTAAAAAEADGPSTQFPSTEFAEDADSASVTVGDLTARISMERRREIDPDADVPVLVVTVGGRRVLEAVGVDSGFDFPLADASIAEIDPGNDALEVYFTSHSGGTHCCNLVVVAEAVGDTWVAVPVGEFDDNGNGLADVNGDGLAEITTVDQAFLYRFDSYAGSAAPLVLYTVRDGAVFDVSGEPRYREAHRHWLKELEETVDPDERWTSPGYLAGWLAAKVRVGEGQEAWAALNRHWNLADDEGEETCLTGGEPEDCPRKDLAIVKFPERLKLFLDENGYRF